jgi:hypothetical protein
VFERQRKDRLVGFIGRQRAQRLRDFRVGDLAPCPELRESPALPQVLE